MSQIDKLIAKALSTSSDDEARNALAIARKKFKENGGSYTTTTNTQADTTDWKSKAHTLYRKYKEQEQIINKLRYELSFGVKTKEIIDLQIKLNNSLFKIKSLQREKDILYNATKILIVIILVMPVFLTFAF
jgi:hypothetical protein